MVPLTKILLKSNFLFSLVQTGLFINNEFVSGTKTIETINPANGEVIASVQAGKLSFYEPAKESLRLIVIIHLW